ncbi:MAG TPA: DUF2244 domain-containing protein [Roseiarcus sp.]|jgi:uncharacterized membrane protein|nr:DUF2244 domain-containing protein [Roseiarcus sp.]
MSEARAIEAPIFDARLQPHRSLGPHGFRALMLGCCLVSTLYSLPFYLMGAWPVVGFLGLDVLLLYLAFRANFRAARAYELLRLTSLELLFARISARGERREWRFHPAWVRLERVEDAEFGTQRLALVSRGRSIEIGGFLGADQKAELAKAFSAALALARGGPRFS